MAQGMSALDFEELVHKALNPWTLEAWQEAGDSGLDGRCLKPGK